MRNFFHIWFRVALCAFMFSLPALSQQPAPKPGPTPTPSADTDVVKISTNLIQLDVTVVDEKGRVVKDLRPEEIEIYENGKKQPITNFSLISAARPLTKEEAKVAKENAKTAAKEQVPVPTSELRSEQVRRTIALVVDDLFLSAESAVPTRRALKKFVDEQMVDGDFVAIIRTGASTGALQQFTSDKNILYEAIERVRFNPNGAAEFSRFGRIQPSFDEMRAAERGAPPTSAPPSTGAQFQDEKLGMSATGSLAALQYIVKGMGELPGRKSLIMFSDGWNILGADKLSENSRLYDQLGKLIEAANRASVVFYTIDASGLQYTGITAADQLSISSASGGTAPPTPGRMAAVMGQRNADLQDSRKVLTLLANETGGLFLRNANDLAGGVRTFLEDQSYYLIAYEPDSESFDPAKRKFNKFEVKILRKGLSARYRSGFANVADETAAKQPVVETDEPFMVLKRTLMSAFTVNDISLRLNALFGSSQEGDYVRSLLHIDAKDLKFTNEPDGSKKAVFDVWAASFADTDLPADQIRKTYTLSVRPEGYQKILDEGFVYFFNFPVKKPGPYQYRVAIRDSQSGKAGSATQFIQVPSVKKGRLTASSIVVENMTTQEWDRLMDPSNSASRSTSSQDTALRRMKPGTVLRYGLEIYNAKLDAGRKPNLQTRIRVFLDGKLVLDGKPIPVDITGQTNMQSIALSGALNLNDKMLPGDYILQVIVTDTLAKKNQQIAAQHVQFEIVP